MVIYFHLMCLNSIFYVYVEYLSNTIVIISLIVRYLTKTILQGLTIGFSSI